jgi:response regulator RpfG family c-di-GMP phosphodiesterase
LSREQIETIAGVGALLHDIGKVRIPKSVLMKEASRRPGGVGHDALPTRIRVIAC